MSNSIFKNISSHKKFVPSKKLGQNFLVNNKVCKDLVYLINDRNFDAIIEVGPGTGYLTDELLIFKKPIYLIELDKRLCEFLSKKYSTNKHIHLLNDDILTCNLNQIIKEYENPIFVTNLPYSISKPFIIKFLQQSSIKICYCMLQKEVAEKLIAQTNTKPYNSFSALTQYYSKTELLIDIDRYNFNPIPKVDSTFVKIIKNDEQYNIYFAKFIKQIFLARRKTMLNNLKQFYYLNTIHDVYNKLKLDKNIRSEQLTPKEIYNLYLLLQHTKNNV